MHGRAHALAWALGTRRRRAGAMLSVVLVASALSLLAPSGVPGAPGHHAGARTAAFYNLTRARPPGPPPHADFVWFPAQPHPGEHALLASVSTAAKSPIVKYAWDLRQGEGFQFAGPTLDTAFTTYAPRTVSLRVTDANGSSDVAVHTIQMSAPPPSVISPFPIVRIVGFVKRRGMRIRELSARLGSGARATVACSGRCPARAQSRAAPVTRAKPVVWLKFRRFQRFLKAGVVLEVRITQPGKIGSFTRFSIRRRKLPARTDTCLSPAGTAPMACPPG